MASSLNRSQKVKSFGKRGYALAKRLNAQEIPFYVLDAAPNFARTKDDAQRLIKAIHNLERTNSVKIGLVVVDTLATTFEGGNENSSEDMGLYISNMKYIQRYANTGVLIVHHSGKDQAAGARGHSSLRAATDTEIEVLSEMKGDRYYRQIRTRKQREGESGLTIRFGLMVIELGKDDDGDIIDTCHVVLENDSEFESVVPAIEDGLATNQTAAFRTVQLFQESEFRQWCKDKKAKIVRELMIKHWLLIKGKPEKIWTLESLIGTDLDYNYKNESSNFSGDFKEIVHHFDKEKPTLKQWIEANLVSQT